MKKFSQIQLRHNITKPARTQSPDFKSGNSIRPTKSPENIQYIIKDMDIHMTPTKTQPMSKSQLNTAVPKYFQNNRSAQQMKSSVYYRSTQQMGNCCQNCSGHCHCVHTNNYEIATQLKKVINLMGSEQVSSFDPQNEDIRKQVLVLSQQNLRLVELVEKLKQKSTTKASSVHQTYQFQISSLRRKLQTQQKQYERNYQELYRTNKTLSSQVKSLEDKNYSSDRQNDRLKALLRQKQEIISIRQQQSRKKNGDQKLSLSLIKDQYNSSVKTLKQNLTFEVEYKLNDYEIIMNQYKLRLDTLQDRINNCQKIKDVNRKLDYENKQLIRQLKLSQAPRQLSQQVIRLQRENRQKSENLLSLSMQLSEVKNYYQNKVNQQKIRNNQCEEALSKQTQIRVKKLMENYEQQIKILKTKTNNVCNHAGIQEENAKLKEHSQNDWQEIIKLRNQLAKSTAEKDRLDGKVYSYQNQISKLKHQISNDHLNLVARTTLLENQNVKLKKQLQYFTNQKSVISQLQEQNALLKKNIQQNNKLSEYIDERQNQIQKLKKDIKYLDLKCTQLQQDKVRMSNQFNILRSECTKVEDEIKKTYQKQIEDNNRYYQQQNNKLQNNNKKLLKQLSDLRTQYQNLQITIKNAQYNQFKAKDDKIYDYELSIRNLTSIVEESEKKLGRLQETNKKIITENQNYINQISVLRLANQSNLRENSQKWEKDTNLLKSKYQQQIGKLNLAIKQKQEGEKQMLMKMTSRISRIKTQSLRRQLQQLKALINSNKFQKLQDQLASLSQNYQRELIKSEQKTMQINNLANERSLLLQKIAELERIKLILQQKVNIQQGNIKLLENQLKQRKNQCEGLSNQKSVLEKENLMLKKMKVDKQTIQAAKTRAREISMKIDKILAMEEQREQLISSNVFSQVVMTESVTRKI